MKRFLLATVFCAISVSATAADGRYSGWTDPDAPTASSSPMVKELRKLITEAEKARAAHPNFLSDLKDLANRYDVTAQSLFFKDDFTDGDYTANPAWKVASGKYWVEKGYGLRSFVEAGVTTQTSSQNEERKVSKEELIIGVLGAVLGGKVQSSGNSGTTQQAAAPVENAEIYLPQRISNAFSMEVDLSSWTAGAKLELGPYQDSKRRTGYRLIYQSGGNPALQLVRYYSNSSSVIDTVSNLKLEDQKYHKLEWTRSSNGDMKVSLDGKLLMQNTDRGFKDDFAGFVMTNKNGDFIIKSISAHGTR